MAATSPGPARSTPAGEVGPIGGIEKKLLGATSAGATLFLAPPSNCGEVLGHIPDGLTVVPVPTLDDAVDVVETWSVDHQATFPTCQQVVDSRPTPPSPAP